MKLSVIRWLASCCLVLVMSFVVLAQKKEMRDAASQSQKSARVFREIMGAPDKAIPKDILDNATCVAVFPQVIKAGFIVGGRGGRGVASCRTKTGWSGPIFLNMGGGSFGLQIGAQATDFILLFMNEGGMNKLLSDNFEIGAQRVCGRRLRRAFAPESSLPSTHERPVRAYRHALHTGKSSRLVEQHLGEHVDLVACVVSLPWQFETRGQQPMRFVA